jgi:hypothetical protein
MHPCGHSTSATSAYSKPRLAAASEHSHASDGIIGIRALLLHAAVERVWALPALPRPSVLR